MWQGSLFRESQNGSRKQSSEGESHVIVFESKSLGHVSVVATGVAFSRNRRLVGL